jgi:formate hydrogenlyase transcriptional activator
MQRYHPDERTCDPVNNQQHEELLRDRDRLRLLLDVNNVMLSNLELPQLLSAIASCMGRIIGQEYTSLALYDRDQTTLRMHALDFPTSKGPLREVLTEPVGSGPAGRAVRSRRPELFDADDLKQFPVEIARRLLAEGVQSVCCIPLISRDRVLGTLNVASVREGAFGPDNVALLEQIATQIAIAVDNALAYQRIAELNEKLSKEKLYLEDEIKAEHNFEEIVGTSPSLATILRQIEVVAPTDSTVLIQGETGTGKELIARAIHNRSRRQTATFVKLNCAAIPTGLLESELFGHEKGAFTGAITGKIGRFELAHGGTIFLDEIGDLSLESQSKLLRVLQEREFERLGSTRTIRTDVRLIAATNRSLAYSVEAKEFRSDLYYRLNVFPICAPPLRDRTEDIPLLVRHFVQKFSRTMRKQIHDIPVEAQRALARYHWPGNIRELENVIERAVILTPGTTLQVPIHELQRAAKVSSDSILSLEEAERAAIARALEQTNWIVGGPAGAAAKLGMKRTTLQGKMRKLNISRPS